MSEAGEVGIALLQSHWGPEGWRIIWQWQRGGYEALHIDGTRFEHRRTGELHRMLRRHAAGVPQDHGSQP